MTPVEDVNGAAQVKSLSTVLDYERSCFKYAILWLKAKCTWKEEVLIYSLQLGLGSHLKTN
jgi:hypothetical protein